jgi:hypothetical protein
MSGAPDIALRLASSLLGPAVGLELFIDGQVPDDQVQVALGSLDFLALH